MNSKPKIVLLSILMFLSAPDIRAQAKLLPNYSVPDSSALPPDFLPVEKEPQIVKQAIAKYPELAQKAGIEGRVILKVLVGKDGIPRKAVVLEFNLKAEDTTAHLVKGEGSLVSRGLKVSYSVFNQPTIDAAMKYRFTPAMLDNKPVSVWVVIPFTFKLRPSPADKIKSSELGVPPGQGQHKIIEKAGLNSASTSSATQLDRLISFYNSGMKYERQKKYVQAVERYQMFLEGVRIDNLNLDEMVRHAKWMRRI